MATATRQDEQRATAAEEARSGAGGADRGWLADRVRTAEDGTARLQVKLGNLH